MPRESDERSTTPDTANKSHRYAVDHDQPYRDKADLRGFAA